MPHWSADLLCEVCSTEGELLFQVVWVVAVQRRREKKRSCLAHAAPWSQVPNCEFLCCSVVFQSCSSLYPLRVQVARRRLTGCLEGPPSRFRCGRRRATNCTRLSSRTTGSWRTRSWSRSWACSARRSGQFTFVLLFLAEHPIHHRIDRSLLSHQADSKGGAQRAGSNTDSGNASCEVEGEGRCLVGFGKSKERGV